MKIQIHKKNLLIYVLCLTGFIVLASFYGGPVSFVPLYALLLVIPVSIAYIFVNYHFLSLFQEIEVHKVSKGENHIFLDGGAANNRTMCVFSLLFPHCLAKHIVSLRPAWPVPD